MDKNWTPTDVVALQGRFRSFYDHIRDGGSNDRDLGHWCHYIQNPHIWKMVQRAVPQLTVREDEISLIGNKSIAALLSSAKEAGFLEPATISTPLNPFHQHDLERMQDYLYRLFPTELHKQVHDFVDEVFQVTTIFPPEVFYESSEAVLITGFGNIEGPERSYRNTFDEHIAAVCDTTLNKICLFYRVYLEDVPAPALHQLRTSYLHLRGMQSKE